MKNIEAGEPCRLGQRGVKGEAMVRRLARGGWRRGWRFDALIVAAAFIASCTGGDGVAMPEHLDGAPGEIVRKITLLRSKGGQVDVGPQDLVAYDAAGEDGRHAVHVMDPEGENDVCLTCGHPEFAGVHAGGPAWHPSGAFLVFIAEAHDHEGSADEAVPGYGQFCNLWVVRADGSQPVKLTDVPATRGHGVLMPHFSDDGRRLSWTELKKAPNLLDLRSRLTAGYWDLHVADVVVDESGLRLEHEQTFEPVANSYYENNGFANREGTQLSYAGNPDGQPIWLDQIYTLDLTTLAQTRLTDEGYNEHPAYSPDFSTIVWMNNVGNPAKGTDWWRMNADGSAKERMTFFNQPSHPHYVGTLWATDISFTKDGCHLVGYVQTNLLKQEGSIVRLDLEPCLGAGVGQ